MVACNYKHCHNNTVLPVQVKPTWAGSDVTLLALQSVDTEVQEVALQFPETRGRVPTAEWQVEQVTGSL